MKKLASFIMIASLLIANSTWAGERFDLSTESVTDAEREIVLTQGFDYMIKYQERDDVHPSEELEKVLLKVRRANPALIELSDIKLTYALVNELS